MSDLTAAVPPEIRCAILNYLATHEIFRKLHPLSRGWRQSCLQYWKESATVFDMSRASSVQHYISQACGFIRQHCKRIERLLLPCDIHHTKLAHNVIFDLIRHLATQFPGFAVGAGGCQCSNQHFRVLHTIDDGCHWIKEFQDVFEVPSLCFPKSKNVLAMITLTDGAALPGGETFSNVTHLRLIVSDLVRQVEVPREYFDNIQQLTIETKVFFRQPPTRRPFAKLRHLRLVLDHRCTPPDFGVRDQLWSFLAASPPLRHIDIAYTDDTFSELNHLLLFDLSRVTTLRLRPRPISSYVGWIYSNDHCEMIAKIVSKCTQLVNFELATSHVEVHASLVGLSQMALTSRLQKDAIAQAYAKSVAHHEKVQAPSYSRSDNRRGFVRVWPLWMEQEYKKGRAAIGPAFAYYALVKLWSESPPKTDADALSYIQLVRAVMADHRIWDGVAFDTWPDYVWSNIILAAQCVWPNSPIIAFIGQLFIAGKRPRDAYKRINLVCCLLKRCHDVDMEIPIVAAFHQILYG